MNILNMKKEKEEQRLLVNTLLFIQVWNTLSLQTRNTTNQLTCIYETFLYMWLGAYQNQRESCTHIHTVVVGSFETTHEMVPEMSRPAVAGTAEFLVALNANSIADISLSHPFKVVPHNRCNLFDFCRMISFDSSITPIKLSPAPKKITTH